MADNYRVLSQRPVVDFTTNGEQRNYIEVSFETIPSGNRGSVKIPAGLYSADYVKAQIEPFAQEMIKVENL